MSESIELVAETARWPFVIIATGHDKWYNLGGQLQRIERGGYRRWRAEYKEYSRSWDNVVLSTLSELNRNWGQSLSLANIFELTSHSAASFVN